MQGTLLVYHYTWLRTANQNRPSLLSWNPNPCLSWGHIATVFISQHLLPLGLTIGQLILSNFQRFADDMSYFGILFVWSCLICPLECWESYLSESCLAFVSTFHLYQRLGVYFWFCLKLILSVTHICFVVHLYFCSAQPVCGSPICIHAG